MLKFEIYNPSKTYLFPSGEVVDYALMQARFPSVAVVPMLVGISGGVVISTADPLPVMRERYGIDDTLDDTTAVAALQSAIDTEQAAALELAQQPSAEERIAAAMEFQNLMSI